MFMHRDIISGFHTKGSKSAGRGQDIQTQNLFSKLPQMSDIKKNYKTCITFSSRIFEALKETGHLAIHEG